MLCVGEVSTREMVITLWHILAVSGKDIFTFAISSVNQGFERRADLRLLGVKNPVSRGLSMQPSLSILQGTCCLLSVSS